MPQTATDTGNPSRGRVLERSHADATKAYLCTPDLSFTRKTVGALLTHICVLHGCLCLTYVVIKSPTFLDGRHRSATPDAGPWSEGADSCCSCSITQHARSSCSLTCVLMKHWHVSRWKGDGHGHRHGQQGASYVQGYDLFEGASCRWCFNTQHGPAGANMQSQRAYSRARTSASAGT